MNQDQLSSLVRSVLKIVGALLISSGVKGAAGISDTLNSPDCIGLVMFIIGMAWSHYSHAGDSSTPPAAPAGGTGSGGSKLPLMLAFACLVFMPVLCFTGCASLQPGADPVVVNTERAETLGKSTFDLVLNTDNTDRAFWATNVPAFHNFCEWLRQPQTIEATNTLPRALALLLSLDDVKRDYQAGLSSSNALQTALVTFEGVVDQAVSWSTIITNQPVPIP